MTRALARVLAVAGLSAGLAVPVLGAGGTAFADPSTETFELACGGTTYTFSLTPGMGEWTPAFDTESHRVFVPHTFGDFHGSVYDTSGHLVDSFDELGTAVQGSGKQKNDVSCTYTFRYVNDGSDPEFPVGYLFVGVGAVTGQLSGH
jgi:hypothetical protein